MRLRRVGATSHSGPALSTQRYGVTARPLPECRDLVPITPNRCRILVRLQPPLEVPHILPRPHRPHLRGLPRRLRRQRTGLVQFPQTQTRGGEDDPAEQPAPRIGGRTQLKRALRVLRRRPELLQIPVAVPELVRQLRLVEEPCPVRDLV